MSMIACTSDCVYQQEGVCNLDRAVSMGASMPKDDGCVHYIKKTKRQSRQK